ncbi:type II secretion system secretin GspD [Aquibium sp. LZ166]|uniref:Type II secretion system secretin GspD n=1 Tax=Aquibium pacificus TaxID=3153579 RepID=A0ABV3SC71_9HYPH
MAVLLAFSTSGCTTGPFLQDAADDVSGRPDPLSGVTQADLGARAAKGGGFLSGFRRARNDNRQGAIYYGTDARLTSSERKSVERLGDEEFDVSLENAEVAVAARTVLGDMLGITYSLDERATGTVSIVTSRPLPAGEILTAFESALRSNGIAMVREGDRLRLMPASDAIGIAELSRGVNVQPGYGVTAYPLRHVSASTIMPLLENFVARQGMVRVDPNGNALLFQGTAAERRAAIDAAISFDQDWLADESVGIFPIQNGTAKSMIPELNRVLDLGEGGRGSNTIRVQPIERNNSLLVVARSRQMLQRAATWIERLDKLEASASYLQVYRVQHLEATRLASMVNQIFNGASAVTEDPAAQFPPDSQPADRSGSGDPAAPATPSDRMADALPIEDDLSTGIESGGGDQGGGYSGGIRVTANPENNSLLILARPDQQRLIEEAILALDRPAAQVAIEATIAEVTLSNDLRYGVQFFLQSGDDGSVGLFKDVAEAAISRVLPGFNLLLGPESDPHVVIDALRGVTEVKVLSSPNLVVLDNKPAVLQVGDEIPIVTRTAQSVTDPEAPIVNNVEFRETGVILKVLPRITANGTINLTIEQEISSVARGSSQSLTPTISQRKIQSTVSVTSGQTVLLGGLISEQQQRGRDGVPVLGDLPIIGEAFRSNQNNATRTELIILIRPQVIKDSLDAQMVAEQMRSQLRIMQEPSRNVPLPRPVKTVIE